MHHVDCQRLVPWAESRIGGSHIHASQPSGPQFQALSNVDQCVLDKLACEVYKDPFALPNLLSYL